MNSKRFMAVIFAVLTVPFVLVFLGINYLIYSIAWCIASLADKLCKQYVWRTDVNAIEFWIIYHFLKMFGQSVIAHIDLKLLNAGEKTLTEEYVSYWGN